MGAVRAVRAEGVWAHTKLRGGEGAGGAHWSEDEGGEWGSVGQCRRSAEGGVGAGVGGGVADSQLLTPVTSS